MATQNPVQVYEIKPGTKIAWRQDGYKIIFGDDELTVRCDTRQRDWATHADICIDADRNLVVGVGTMYVAQLDIPAREYIDVPDEDPEVDEETGEVIETQESSQATHPEPVALDMGEVVLTLWPIDAWM